MEIVKGMYIRLSMDVITAWSKPFLWCAQYVKESVFVWHCTLDASQMPEVALANNWLNKW